jgi:hypothetical protein
MDRVAHERGLDRSAEFPAVAHRLLQMPAGDLIEVDEVAGGLFKPVPEAVVEIRPPALG